MRLPNRAFNKSYQLCLVGIECDIIFVFFNFPVFFGGHQMFSTVGAEQLCPILHSCCWSSQSLPVFGGDHLGELHFSVLYFYLIAGSHLFLAQNNEDKRSFVSFSVSTDRAVEKLHRILLCQFGIKGGVPCCTSKKLMLWSFSFIPCCFYLSVTFCSYKGQKLLPERRSGILAPFPFPHSDMLKIKQL